MVSILIDACDSDKRLTDEELAFPDMSSGHDLAEKIRFSSCYTFDLKSPWSAFPY